MSFIATANSIAYTGATPVFADVDPETYNLHPDAARAAITSRTRAILVVHQIGMPADMSRFAELANKHGVLLLEDAACAIGSRYQGRPIGGHGTMACFSFHPRKVISCGEGGMITTNDADIAARMRLLRQHGMNVPDTVRHASQKVIQEEYVCVGYNYRMTDIQAAIGCVQMAKLDEIVRLRREKAARYSHALSNHPWLSTPIEPSGCESNFQSYAVQLSPDAPLSRDELMQRLLDDGIATRRGIMLSHREPPYRSARGSESLTHSEWASDHSLLLPLFPDLSHEDQDRVCDALWKHLPENLASVSSVSGRSR